MGGWFDAYKVTAISPEPGPVQNDDMADVESIYGATGTQQDNRMRNGSMVVEQVRGKQGYDSRLKNYDADLSVSLPIALRPGTSLISTVSAEIGQQKPLQLFHERMWSSE